MPIEKNKKHTLFKRVDLWLGEEEIKKVEQIKDDKQIAHVSVAIRLAIRSYESKLEE